ncbi:MAG: FeoB-associated Cys-rich membrane protein [Angelakisella sp.]
MISNISTIVVAAVVAAVIGLVIYKMVSDRKKGKSSCGCSCANCPSAGMCHTK